MADTDIAEYPEYGEKLITFTVPCYNSAGYMRKCLESLLAAGDDAEIIIVDDGSKDETGDIADEYATEYSSIVRVFHQENGGHGACLNKGIKEAKGLYFKVVDSDDWLDADALKKLIECIRGQVSGGFLPDVICSNFIYDKATDGTKYVSRYTMYMKEGFNDWEDVKPFRLWHMLLIHALQYRTDILRDCGVVMPEHTFYEDNYFAYAPLLYTRNIYYLNVDLYHYLIGRGDQSVTVKNILGRYEHQLRVMSLMISERKYADICRLPRGLKKYICHNLSVIMANTLYFTCGKYSAERKKNLTAMWDSVKEEDPEMYKFLRHHTNARILMPLPWRLRGFVAGAVYKFLCSYVKLG